MAHLDFEADKMLDVYIYDYLVKRKYGHSARIFQREARIPTNPSAIDAPGGFLSEWWSVFWDVFISRNERLGPPNETQIRRAPEQLQQWKWPISQKEWLAEMQRQLVLEKHIEQQQMQQQRDEIQLRPGLANTNINRQSLARSAASGDQPQQQFLHDTPAGNSNYFHPKKNERQQLLEAQSSINPTTNLRATSSDGSLHRASGSGQAVNNIPLEGWPRMVVQQQVLNSNQPSQQAEYPNYQPPQPDKTGAAASTTDYAAMSSASRDNDLHTTKQILRKRKQPISPVEPGEGSGTVKTTAPAPISPPSTQAQAAGDMIFMTNFPHEDSTSNVQVLGSGSVGPCTSEQNKLDDLHHFVNNGSLADNVESFSSSNPESKNTSAACLDASQDVTFLEIGTICANSVSCCDLSSDGKLIATSGNDQKIVLWCTDSREQKCVIGEHSDVITDIRFGPRLPRIATSSRDKTVKVWNANNPGHSQRTFSGHSASVMSLDFHPEKQDLLCSCDYAREIRYWDIRSGGCTGVSKGGATQVRFQPTHGRYLVAAVQDSVSIIDVETAQTCMSPLKGHATNVLSVCWNSSGEYLASLSEDLVRVWKVGPRGQQGCIHELSLSSKKFHCCSFHPSYPSLLVIGFDQSLEFWNMAENKMTTVLEHPINTLAVSQLAGLIASAADGNLIKLWK